MKDQRLTTEERQELVAFLDGEADPSVSQRLEVKINHSVSAQREAEQLRRVWDLLDFLQMPATTDAFTHRTMELAALEIERSAQVGESVVRWGRIAAALAAWAAGLVACAVGGFIAVSYWPDRNRRLVEDLPIVEQLEEYQAVKDVDFLRKVHDLRLLDDLDDAGRPRPRG